MRRFLVLFLIQNILYFLSIVLISIDIKHFNLPLAVACSVIGGLLGIALLNLFLLKKHLIADIDFTDSEGLTENRELKSHSYSYNWKQAIPFSCFIITVLAFMRFRYYTGTYFTFFLIGASILLFITIFDLLMTRLHVSEKGIELQSLFGKINASWNDIIGVMQVIRGDEVLIFQKMSYSNIFIEAIHGDYISISLFDRKWKTGEMGKIIQNLAPQLKFIESTQK